MARLIIFSVILLLSAIGLMLWRDTSSPGFILASGFAFGFAIPLVEAAIRSFGRLKIVWYSLKNWNRLVRVSVSYLYRIQVEGDYLLVHGSRFNHFQPVGGVYKMHPSSSGDMKKMRVRDDQLIALDDVNEGDLRIRVPGKHLFGFVRWFESREGREIDGWREFQEELIETGILPREEFRHIKYDFIAQRIQPPRFSAWAQSQELFIADIFELLPSPEQLKALKELKGRHEPRVLWASEEQISRRGAMAGSAEHTTHIAETAMWVVEPDIKSAR